MRSNSSGVRRWKGNTGVSGRSGVVSSSGPVSLTRRHGKRCRPTRSCGQFGDVEAKDFGQLGNQLWSRPGNALFPPADGLLAYSSRPANAPWLRARRVRAPSRSWPS